MLSLNVYSAFQPVAARNFFVSGICKVTSDGRRSAGSTLVGIGFLARETSVVRKSPTDIVVVPPMLYASPGSQYIRASQYAIIASRTSIIVRIESRLPWTNSFWSPASMRTTCRANEVAKRSVRRGLRYVNILVRIIFILYALK